MYYTIYCYNLSCYPSKKKKDVFFSLNNIYKIYIYEKISLVSSLSGLLKNISIL